MVIQSLKIGTQYDFQLPKIVFGANSIASLPKEVNAFSKSKRVFIVTDKGIKKSGIIDNISELLRKSGVEFAIFESVVGEPTIQIVKEAMLAIKESKCDLVIGIGGGSCLDVAKSASLVDNLENVHEIVLKDTVVKPGLPVITVPTTFCNGSELSYASLIKLEDGVKHILHSPYLIPKVTIIDPSLTISLPQKQTLYSGLDALSHAVEAFMSKKAYALTDSLSQKAIKIIFENLPATFADGENLDIKYNMCLASLMAVIAVMSGAGVCLGHALSHTLGGYLDKPHGFLSGVALPYAMEYNIPAAYSKLAKVARIIGEKNKLLNMRELALKAIKNITDLYDQLNISVKLQEIKEDKIPELVEIMFTFFKSQLVRNPRVITKDDAIKIFINIRDGKILGI
jgi:alcohol dehydrogenase class IV